MTPTCMNVSTDERIHHIEVGRFFPQEITCVINKIKAAKHAAHFKAMTLKFEYIFFILTFINALFI